MASVKTVSSLTYELKLKFKFIKFFVGPINEPLQRKEDKVAAESTFGSVLTTKKKKSSAVVQWSIFNLKFDSLLSERSRQSD